MSEFLSDLAANWDNGYWWADHPFAQAVIVGAIGVVFTLVQVGLQRRLAPRPGVTA